MCWFWKEPVADNVSISMLWLSSRITDQSIKTLSCHSLVLFRTNTKRDLQMVVPQTSPNPYFINFLYLCTLAVQILEWKTIISPLIFLFSQNCFQYYAESHGLIYVVDSSDKERLTESRLAFGKYIKHLLLTLNTTEPDYVTLEGLEVTHDPQSNCVVPFSTFQCKLTFSS